jgi:hypothetical protein
MFDRLIYPVTILKDLNIRSTYDSTLLFTFLGFEPTVPRTQLFIIIIIFTSIIVFIFDIREPIHDYSLQYQWFIQWNESFEHLSKVP